MQTQRSLAGFLVEVTEENAIFQAVDIRLVEHVFQGCLRRCIDSDSQLLIERREKKGHYGPMNIDYRPFMRKGDSKLCSMPFTQLRLPRSYRRIPRERELMRPVMHRIIVCRLSPEVVAPSKHISHVLSL